MKDYRDHVLKTESIDFDKIRERLKSPSDIRMLHASIGIATETGELLDAMKKYIFYGRELDKVNLIEELGDLMWYLEVAMDVLNIKSDEVKRINIDKLKARYGENFSSERAINRDLDNEVAVMKGK